MSDPTSPPTSPQTSPVTAPVTVPVAVSARHVHLSEHSIATLFGAGHVLRVHTWLNQPGQFAAEETVTLVGPKGSLPHVRIVGPARAEDQVEISRTDEIALGLNAPVRLSGELAHTPGIELIGPAGRLMLDHGVVLAQRHVHVSPAEAARLGLHDHQIVQAAVGSPERALVFNDVIVRVSPHYRAELHLDTDEGNAAGVQPGDQALLSVAEPGA
jgi:acetate kinase